MSKYEYEIPPGLSDRERRILEAKRDICFNTIHGQSLRWSVVLDTQGRQLFRLTDYTLVDKCYLETSLDEIEILEDWQFKNAIVGNERPCSSDEP